MTILSFSTVIFGMTENIKWKLFSFCMH